MKRNNDTGAKAAMVIKRLGATTGASKGSKPLPPMTVKPTGNPFKGKVGLTFKKKF